MIEERWTSMRSGPLRTGPLPLGTLGCGEGVIGPLLLLAATTSFVELSS